MTKIITSLNAIVWGAPALVLILGVGMFLSVRLRFVQLRLFPWAFRDFCRRLWPGKQEKGVSGFQALCTALAATVGTGNLVGVAGAICLGGPGAIFWMWLCGLLGMVTKFAEAALAVRYRIQVESGYVGGPMYVMTNGLGEGWRPMAVLYSIFGLIAAFGVGNSTQVNAVITGINTVLIQFDRQETGLQNLLMGILLAAFIGILLLGGAKAIGQAAERLVPLAAAAYIFLCIGVLAVQFDRIPAAVATIFQGAFSPKAVTGGTLGSAFQALRIGCSRGVFTNEAGMGTASMAHGSAEVSHPVQQGLMGIMEVFLDTIVICTMTALVILVSGIPIPYGRDAGGTLTMEAFASVYGTAAPVLITLALILFAVATILGWGLYGARCAQFLFGAKAWKPFVLVQTLTVVLGSIVDTATIWQLSETVNGLMAIPNLITLAWMAPELVRLTKEYEKTGTSAAGGGNYADFHQRKPLRTISHAEIPSAGCGSQKRG